LYDEFPVCSREDMQLTEDSFRALARSSPWRFSTLHFTRRDGDGDGSVEAWLRRPGWLRVVDASGREIVQQDGPAESRSVRLVVALPDGGPLVLPPAPPAPVTPEKAAPELRPDGLVAVRPDALEVAYDDPMYVDYRWVAMLDPVELSSGTVVADLAEDELFGRPVWRARMTTVDGYDPRCSCCPLLWGEVSDTVEYGAPRPGADYPAAYDVMLDVETGIVVSLRPVGGEDDWLEVEIHDVDQLIR
jgi:hypothetical protein